MRATVLHRRISGLRDFGLACVDFHNDHKDSKDSPRTDIELGDVIEGVVIRIPMD